MIVQSGSVEMVSDQPQETASILIIKLTFAACVGHIKSALLFFQCFSTYRPTFPTHQASFFLLLVSLN